MRKFVPLVGIAYLLSMLPTSLAANSELLVRHYIDQYKAIAISEMERTGIPASITLAQAIVESKYGTSTLSLQSNNHFGIKCKGGWNGKSVYFKDDDYQNGRLVNSCFRGYDDPVQSYYDHSDFLLENKRYRSLFQLGKTNYTAWAKGLKACGYATNRKYAYTLIETVEKYQLYLYDQTTSLLQPAYALSIPVSNKVTTYPAKQSPPKVFRLPSNYRRGQGSRMRIVAPTPYQEKRVQQKGAYLFEIIPQVERKDVR